MRRTLLILTLMLTIFSCSKFKHSIIFYEGDLILNAHKEHYEHIKLDNNMKNPTLFCSIQSDRELVKCHLFYYGNDTLYYNHNQNINFEYLMMEGYDIIPEAQLIIDNPSSNKTKLHLSLKLKYNL